MPLWDGDPASVGDYTLESRLGSGGMGVVHLARSSFGRRAAVKVVHEQFAADPEFRARFRQEVAAARRVSGAYTAPVVDADPDAERPWMATLYVPGPTLSERVEKEGPLPPEELWRFATGLAEALRDIHRAGVVHRDLKPSNVLLAEDGPKVIDFGISRPFDSDLRTETGKVIGTPPFMAPEQFRSPRQVGPAADVFSMGCLLVHAATGRGPFDADSPYLVAYQVVHDEPDLRGVPQPLRPLVLRCLEKDPAARPAPDELMAMLRAEAASWNTAEWKQWEEEQRSSDDPGPEAVDDGGGSEGDEARGTAPVPATGRRRRRALLAAATVCALAGAVVVGVERLGSAAPDRPPEPPGRSAGSGPGSARAGWETGVSQVRGADPGTVRSAKCTSAGGALYCADHGVAAARIDMGGGEIAWSRKAPPRGPGGDGWVRRPEMAGGLVQVARPGNRLEALDPRTGAVRWHTDTSAYNGCCYFAGDAVLLVTAGGEVTALDGATGRRLWRGRVPGQAQPVFQYHDGTAYAVSWAGDGSWTRVTAVRPGTGEVEWEHRLSGNLTPFGASDGSLYLTQSAENSDETVAVVSYDPATRQVRRAPLEIPAYGADAVVRGTTAYLLEDDGTLTAVDTRRTDGEAAERWQLETAVSNPSPPTVAGGRLYISAADGRLLVVDLREGQLAGQTEPRMDPRRRGYLSEQPAPIVADGVVYAFTPKGTVFSVNARDLGR